MLLYEARSRPGDWSFWDPISSKSSHHPTITVGAWPNISTGNTRATTPAIEALQESVSDDEDADGDAKPRGSSHSRPQLHPQRSTLVIGMVEVCGQPSIVENRRLQVRCSILTAAQTASDYKRCDSTHPAGCPRCKTPMPAVCCDLCHPAHFAKYYKHDELPAKRGAGKSSLTLDRSQWTPTDKKVFAELFRWRQDKALSVLGINSLKTFGPQLFMSDEVIERLVKCIHFDKISTVDELRREVDWSEDMVDVLLQKAAMAMRELLSSERAQRAGRLGTSGLPHETEGVPRCYAFDPPTSSNSSAADTHRAFQSSRPITAAHLFIKSACELLI
ncbi:hypothetical protein NMY22_g13776 [Coprinellus aureogranulatus]|nr:hypothetical protein NMY22_g13776 [Coprinellus aureogranulatus]